MVLRDVHKSPGIGNEPNRAAKIGDLFEGVHPEPSEESPVSVNGADDQPATTIDKTDSSKEGATLAETTNTTHSDSVKADDWASRIERVTLLVSLSVTGV
ncbi:hypothetical protein V9T40_002820 [Parthenolecanium corni]|uniref:Uncharacterized protein n=1 Tax=Parthenolecanium corni TaxID=536013 RepID=A0AAN9TV61_9HEMI